MVGNDRPQWGTLQEAATELGLSLATVRRYADQGIIEAVRIGKRTIRVDMRSVWRVGREMRERRDA